MQRSRIRLLTFLAALAGGSLAGCGGGGGGDLAELAPSPSPAPGPAPAPLPVRRTFAYVPTATDIEIFRIGDDGALGEAGKLAVTNVRRFAFHPSGKFAYGTRANNALLFTVHPETGMLELNGTFAAGDQPVSIAIDPSGSFAYVANVADNSISMYAIDGNGNLQDNGRLPVVDAPRGLSMHPSGQFLLIGTRVNVISVRIDSTGKLIDDKAVASRITEQMSISRDGRFAYVNNTDSSIATLSIDPDTGELGPPSFNDVASGGPLVFDAAGTVAYMAAETGNAIVTFNMDPDSGVYTARQVVQPLSGPNAIALDPTGRFLYATNVTDNSLIIFAIESGLLSSIGTPTALSSTPSQITTASIYAPG